MDQQRLFIVEIKDKRDWYILEAFVAKGYETCIFGNECLLYKDHIYLMSVSSAISDDIIKNLKSPSILFARDLDESKISLAKKRDIKYFNYFSDEELVVKNAYLTAEGTLKYIIENTDETIVGMNALIIGYGRVGKAVAKVLKDNYFNIAIANRNPKALSESLLFADRVYNLQSFSSDLDKFKVIINTIPHLILEGEALKNIRKDAFVIDLASKPGGVDFQALNKAGIRNIHALGVPAVVAPKTAAKYITDYVLKELNL